MWNTRLPATMALGWSGPRFHRGRCYLLRTQRCQTRDRRIQRSIGLRPDAARTSLSLQRATMPCQRPQKATCLNPAALRVASWWGLDRHFHPGNPNQRGRHISGNRGRSNWPCGQRALDHRSQLVSCTARSRMAPTRLPWAEARHAYLGTPLHLPPSVAH